MDNKYKKQDSHITDKWGNIVQKVIKKQEASDITTNSLFRKVEELFEIFNIKDKP